MARVGPQRHKKEKTMLASQVIKITISYRKRLNLYSS